MILIWAVHFARNRSDLLIPSILPCSSLHMHSRVCVGGSHVPLFASVGAEGGVTAVARIPCGEAFMAGYRIRCGDFPDIAEQEYELGTAPTAEPKLSTVFAMPRSRYLIQGPDYSSKVQKTERLESRSA